MKLADIGPYVTAEELAKVASSERRPKRVLRAHAPGFAGWLRRLVVRLN